MLSASADRHYEQTFWLRPAHVSTLNQNLDTQLDALQRAGCNEIFQDKITGISTSRPALDGLQVKLRPGDTMMTVGRRRTTVNAQVQRLEVNALLSGFAQQGIHFKALDLGVDSSTPAGELVFQIFAALAEYDGTGHPAGEPIEENTVGPVLATAQGKHRGRPKGLDAEKLAKIKTAIERGLLVAETVSLTGISMSNVKRYCKQLGKALP